VLFYIDVALSLSTDECRAYPGTSPWPSTSTWDQLNSTIAGRLIRPAPPGGVCHAGQPNFDESQCASVQEAWSDFNFHIVDPVSVTRDNWANWTCQPDPELPCSGAGYPVYVINATTAAHVKAGVDFGGTNSCQGLKISS
jgi:hypothetical protein